MGDSFYKTYSFRMYLDDEFEMSIIQHLEGLNKSRKAEIIRAIIKEGFESYFLSGVVGGGSPPAKKQKRNTNAKKPQVTKKEHSTLESGSKEEKSNQESDFVKKTSEADGFDGNKPNAVSNTGSEKITSEPSSESLAFVVNNGDVGRDDLPVVENSSNIGAGNTNLVSDNSIKQPEHNSGLDGQENKVLSIAKDSVSAAPPKTSVNLDDEEDEHFIDPLKMLGQKFKTR